MSRPPVFLTLLPPLILAGLLVGCGPSERDTRWRGDAPKTPADPAATAGYFKPPALTASRAQPDGAVLLTGQAAPRSAVRLASPAGEILNATADAAGGWSFRLAPSAEVRLFGLSMAPAGARRVQSQGYLAILPDGRAAQLRSGISAYVYGEGSDAPRLLSLDFDRDGAAFVSGSARAASGLSLRIDRTARANGEADHEGRFHLAVERPLNAGALSFEIAGESGEQAVVIPVSAAPELPTPFRAARSGAAWRIDWKTPGGGVQSTLILDPVP